MTDQSPSIPLLKAVSVRVNCLLHGRQHIIGTLKVYNVGYGGTVQNTDSATCNACPNDEWLHLELFEETVVEVERTEYAAAQMAALEDEIGTPEPEEEVADEKDGPGVPGTTASPGPKGDHRVDGTGPTLHRRFG